MVKQVKHTQREVEPEPVVRYFPETQSLWIDSGKSLGEGETIAKGVVLFYGKDDDTAAEGVRIEFAEHVLKPFVDAIVEKHSTKPKRADHTAAKGAQIQAIVHTLRRHSPHGALKRSIPVPRLSDG